MLTKREILKNLVGKTVYIQSTGGAFFIRKSIKGSESLDSIIIEIGEGLIKVDNSINLPESNVIGFYDINYISYIEEI